MTTMTMTTMTMMMMMMTWFSSTNVTYPGDQPSRNTGLYGIRGAPCGLPQWRRWWCWWWQIDADGDDDDWCWWWQITAIHVNPCPVLQVPCFYHFFKILDLKINVRLLRVPTTAVASNLHMPEDKNQIHIKTWTIVKDHHKIIKTNDFTSQILISRDERQFWRSVMDC